ncbi:MAG TPA: hypothetical protein VHE83_07070 [Mycobacteriales bacterium]|nr:hypothetical protein [Mycobacteriales bacterium]
MVHAGLDPNDLLMEVFWAVEDYEPPGRHRIEVTDRLRALARRLESELATPN